MELNTVLNSIKLYLLQPCLKATLYLRSSLEIKFINFLQNNRFYDEVLMVNQGFDLYTFRGFLSYNFAYLSMHQQSIFCIYLTNHK